MDITANVLNISSEAVQDLFSNKYVYALIVFVSFFLIAKLVVYISEKYLLRLTKKTKTPLDDLIVKRTHKPISLLLLLFGIKMAIIPLKLNEQLNLMTNSVLNTLLVTVSMFIAIFVLDIFIEVWGESWAAKTRSRVDVNLLSLFRRFSRIFAAIIGFLFILHVWGVQVGPLLASLGIAGIAIAFALQSTLGNIFGGISLIIDKTIKKGDIISLESGELGTVHDVGIRSTKILTLDNDIVTIPNGKLADSRIKNISQPDLSTRVNIDFGVEYGSDIEKVKQTALNAIKKINGIIKKPEPCIWFMEMGEFALKFRLLFWIEDMQKKWDIQSDAVTIIYADLNRAKIGIPFPTRTVYLKK